MNGITGGTQRCLYLLSGIVRPVLRGAAAELVGRSIGFQGGTIYGMAEVVLEPRIDKVCDRLFHIQRDSGGSTAEGAVSACFSFAGRVVAAWAATHALLGWENKFTCFDALVISSVSLNIEIATICCIGGAILFAKRRANPNVPLTELLDRLRGGEPILPLRVRSRSTELFLPEGAPEEKEELKEDDYGQVDIGFGTSYGESFDSRDDEKRYTPD